MVDGPKTLSAIVFTFAIGSKSVKEEVVTNPENSLPKSLGLLHPNPPFKEAEVAAEEEENPSECRNVSIHNEQYGSAIMGIEFRATRLGSHGNEKPLRSFLLEVQIARSLYNL
ncbi:hypothetical protein ACJRO7_020686 [Eucalyptus globulus]|uniref:Uncharacterized protein n=1 Tax=Eucalyptus globulus TaxID=34317 RepID=A0ABD3KK55_EUCGL